MGKNSVCARLHLSEPLPETFMNHLTPDRQLAFLVCNHIYHRCCLWINHCLSSEYFLDSRLQYRQIPPTIKAGSNCPIVKEGDAWGKLGSWDPGLGTNTSAQAWSLVFLKSWHWGCLLAGYAKSQLGFWKKWVLPKRSFLLISEDILLLLDHSCCHVFKTEKWRCHSPYRTHT